MKISWDVVFCFLKNLLKRKDKEKIENNNITTNIEDKNNLMQNVENNIFLNSLPTTRLEEPPKTIEEKLSSLSNEHQEIIGLLKPINNKFDKNGLTDKQILDGMKERMDEVNSLNFKIVGLETDIKLKDNEINRLKEENIKKIMKLMN